MKHIVLGVTGSIAAYKAAEIVSRLRKAGHEVKVILTKNGSEFITPLTLETLSKNPVACDMFERKTLYEVEHIALAKWANVFVIAPATANFIAKYAVGIADDMLTTTVLAARAPVIIAPAMNTAMYEHETTQENIKKLKERGVLFVEPSEGLLACGDSGRGRMEDPEKICAFIEDLFIEKDLVGRSILVTAGAAREDIDPVRYITNRSTGNMGVSIANAAARRGAHVILIAGSIQKQPRADVETVYVRSTQDMYDAVHAHLDGQDVVISAAAPADFTPENRSDVKIKKQDTDAMTLRLVPTQDILKSIADKKGKRLHIGFAAETNDIDENAKKKLEAKSLDAIAANDVSEKGGGFGFSDSALTLFCTDGNTYRSGRMSKTELADWLLDRIIDLWK